MTVSNDVDLKLALDSVLNIKFLVYRKLKFAPP